LRVSPLASIAMIVATTACGGTAAHQRPAALPSRLYGSQTLVGRWALVTLARDGEDRTIPSMANAGAVVYYYFNADGTFRIVQADSVRETGTWSVDTTMSPKVFDHIPDADGKPGPYVPGIFAIDGDTLKISIIPPNPARRHPTQFRSTPADSSWLLIFRRAAR
jgi:uncharacterized protein (TIGR03067 family)